MPLKTSARSLLRKPSLILLWGVFPLTGDEILTVWKEELLETSELGGGSRVMTPKLIAVLMVNVG